MVYFNDQEEYVKVMDGKSFIKSAVLSKEPGILFITFYNTYEEFLQDHPNSKLTKKDYDDYLSDIKVDKLLTKNTAETLRRFPELDSVSLSVPKKGKEIILEVQRKELNEYIDKPIENLSSSDQTWQKHFLNVYVDGVQNLNRDKYIKKFMRE